MTNKISYYNKRMRKTIQKGVNDLSTWCEQNGRMDLLMEWDYEKNNPITPEDVTAGSNTSFWWKDKLGHSWSMRVYCRSNQHQKCPYCSGRKVLKGFNDLLYMYAIFVPLVALVHGGGGVETLMKDKNGKTVCRWDDY